MCLTGQTNPNNTVTGATFGYTGQHEKLTETFSLNLTQMGARVYLASTGRFLQVDPIEGGTSNAYAYVNNPVNDFDLSGQKAQRGRQSKQPKQLSNEEKRALDKKKSGKPLTPKEKKLAKSGEHKEGVTNEKLGGARRHRTNITINIPSKKAIGAAVSVIAGAAVVVWWAAKPVGLACGPFAPACMVIL